MVPDPDGSTRLEALVVESRGHYYPSLALETVRVAAGLDPFALQLDFGRAVRLGSVAVPIDARARGLVDYAGPGGTFWHVPAGDVLHGRVGTEGIRDHIVFIGATAEGTYDLRVTPFSSVFPSVEKHANMAANLLDGRFITRGRGSSWSRHPGSSPSRSCSRGSCRPSGRRGQPRLGAVFRLHGDRRRREPRGAARVAEQGVATSTRIIIGEGTYAAAKDAIEVRRLGEVTVKGKTRPVVVYERLALKTR